MVLPDLFAQRGPFHRNAGTSTPGLGVLNALTQQIKQSSLHAPKGDQWKEFHQLLKGALQQARQDVREARRDDRHQSIREAHQERGENHVEARLDRRSERIKEHCDASPFTPKPVCDKPAAPVQDDSEQSVDAGNEHNTLEQLIKDLRQLGLTLPGEHAETSVSETDETPIDDSTHAPIELDTPSLIDALPNITEQLQTLLPKLPPHEQTLLTQALSGLEKFGQLVSTSATDSGEHPVILPTDKASVSLQESLKNVVSALPEEAKDALKQVFQLLNDAKQARHQHLPENAQALNHAPDVIKPFENKFVHPLQALLRHLGEANETRIAQATSSQFGSASDNPSSQSDKAPPALADILSVDTTDTDTSGMSVPFNDVAVSSASAFDPNNVALSTTITMTSRAGIGMTNPITQNRPQAVNHPIQSQVVEAAQIAIKDGKNELVVQLNPQHLGKVTVTLTSDANKQVTAVLVTESHHVQHELEKDIKSFIRSMEHHGVNLVKVSVIQANTETQTSHNAAQDNDPSQQQQQSMNHQGSNHSSGSHSQREAFEWRQQFIHNNNVSSVDSGNLDSMSPVDAPTVIETPTESLLSDSDQDRGVDLRA